MDREHFYKFPEPTGDEKSFRLQWHIDPRSRRYICKRIHEDSSPSEVLAIAQVLVSEVIQLPPLDRDRSALATRDLSSCIAAFLAHTLFSESKMERRVQAQIRTNITNIFERLKPYLQGLELLDVYEIGLTLILDPADFLDKFQPQLDWYNSFFQYTHSTFKRSLGDELRSKLRDRYLNRSNLGMLNGCKSSRLEKLLVLWGEQGDRVVGLLTLHQCFQELVIAKEFVTNKPQIAQYDALLARYRERSVGSNFEIVDRDQATELLQYMSNSLRNYRQPGVVSFESPLDKDQPKEKLGDSLGGDLQPTSQKIVVAEHYEVRELALSLIGQHDLDLKLLFLDGLGLTQTETGIELGCNQSTIGRQRISLLRKVADELYLTYHKLPPKTNIPIEIRSKYIDYIELICDDYFSDLLRDILTEIIKSDSNESNIEIVFINRLETQWQFKFKSNGMGLSKATAFVQRRLNLASFFPDEL